MSPWYPGSWNKLAAILASIRRIRRGERYWLRYDGQEWRAISGETVID